jgi:hypothetical protein
MLLSLLLLTTPSTRVSIRSSEFARAVEKCTTLSLIEKFITVLKKSQPIAVSLTHMNPILDGFMILLF